MSEERSIYLDLREKAEAEDRVVPKCRCRSLRVERFCCCDGSAVGIDGLCDGCRECFRGKGDCGPSKSEIVQ